MPIGQICLYKYHRFHLFTANKGAALSLLYMRPRSSLKLNKYTHTQRNIYTYTRPTSIVHLRRGREQDRLRLIPPRSLCQCANSLRRGIGLPQIEAALSTIMRLNDERVMLVFLLCCSLRSVALRSAIPWDTVPPSMALLSPFRSH